jgi:hypothetical protein
MPLIQWPCGYLFDEPKAAPPTWGALADTA